MNFRTMFSEVVVKPSPCGDKVYSYDYYNKKGVLCHDKRDFYAMIQSCVSMVDYKRSIMDYGVVGNPELVQRDGIYADVSDVGTDGFTFLRSFEDCLARCKEDYVKYSARKKAGKIGIGSEEVGEVVASQDKSE